jgi:hypothetical protein
MAVLIVVVLVGTYIGALLIIGPLAKSKGYTVTYESVLPIVNLLALIFFLLVPPRSPRRRVLTPEQQKKKNVRVTPPDEHGRYR